MANGGCASFVGYVIGAITQQLVEDGRVDVWRASQLNRIRTNQCEKDGGPSANQTAAEKENTGPIAMTPRNVVGSLLMVAIAVLVAFPLSCCDSREELLTVGASLKRKSTALKRSMGLGDGEEEEESRQAEDPEQADQKSVSVTSSGSSAGAGGDQASLLEGLQEVKLMQAELMKVVKELRSLTRPGSASRV